MVDDGAPRRVATDRSARPYPPKDRPARRRPGLASEILDALDVAETQAEPPPDSARFDDGSGRGNGWGGGRYDEGRRPSRDRGPLPWIIGGALLGVLLPLMLVGALALAGSIGAPTVVPTESPNLSAEPSVEASVEPSVEPSPSPTPTPSPTPSPTATPAPTPFVYVVRSGDTLFAIANRFGVTIDQITAANGITRQSVLKVGQHLVIPGQ